MKWSKRAPTFVAQGQFDWMQHHAQLPVPDRVDDDTIRIYFSTRDTLGRSRGGLIEVDAGEPSIVRHLHPEPVIDLGGFGTFDESGVMPSCILHVDGKTYMYYIGWSLRTTVPYHLAIGLAVSEDGVHFSKISEGPVMDRTPDEPFLATTPMVEYDAGKWRMWYSSGIKWLVIDDRPENVYVVRYAESTDGIEWHRAPAMSIPQKKPDEAQARPWVMQQRDGTRQMWYSYRGSYDFRSAGATSYRIGYAESSDGVTWERLDDHLGLEVSEDGWDAEMTCYPSTYEHAGDLHMLYNGNGFGTTGIGHSVYADE